MFDLTKEAEVQKVVNFYLANTMALSESTNYECDAEIKIRVVPNTDKNVDAKFVIVASGKILIPGKEEVVANLKEEPKTEETSTEEIKDGV